MGSELTGCPESGGRHRTSLRSASRPKRISADGEKATSAGPQAGFSVLEAIVALALLGVTIVPLLAWQAQMARDAAGIERSLGYRLAESVALQYMNLMNPAGPASGEQSLGGGWELAWSAEPLTPTRALRYGIRNMGRHQGALFLIRGQLKSPESRIVMLETPVIGIQELRPFEPF